MEVIHPKTSTWTEYENCTRRIVRSYFFSPTMAITCQVTVTIKWTSSNKNKHRYFLVWKCFIVLAHIIISIVDWSIFYINVVDTTSYIEPFVIYCTQHTDVFSNNSIVLWDHWITVLNVYGYGILQLINMKFRKYLKRFNQIFFFFWETGEKIEIWVV